MIYRLIFFVSLVARLVGTVCLATYCSVAYKSLSRIEAKKSRLPAVYKPNSNISQACIRSSQISSEIGDQDNIKIVAKNRRIRMKWSAASYDAYWESYESHNMHTNSLIKIITLKIFYFGQRTNHQEFSVSLQRGCRLAPLQSVSNLRNAAEGSK